MTKINTAFADSHVHTEYSHDSRCTVAECAAAALERGLAAITVTDHCDISFCRDESNLDNVKLSAEDARRVDEEIGDRLAVISGVELGDGEWNPSLARSLAAYDGFEVILGSVHSVPYKNYGMAFSCVNFGGWKKEELVGFMNRYFDEVLEMIRTFDFNILSHLTVPLRYINGKYGHGISAELFYPAIERILSEIIERGIALEINTSTYAAMSVTLPDEAILRMYKELGGRLVSLGSDAHIPELVASNFSRAAEMIKKCGFDSYVYMRNKKFISVSI